MSKPTIFKNKNAPFLARAVVYSLTLGLASVCFILLPELAREEIVEKGIPFTQTLPFLLISWVVAMPIFAGLYEANKIVNLLKEDKIFTKKTLKPLTKIKKYILIFNGLFLASLTALIFLGGKSNPREDVTGFVTLGILIVVVATTIYSLVLVLEKLLTEAIKAKKENDSTI